MMPGTRLGRPPPPIPPRSLKRPSGWMRFKSRSCSSWRSAAAGTSALTACNQRLRTRTRAPAAVARSLIASSDAVGRAKSQTEMVVSWTRLRRRGKTGETAGRCAANPAGRNTSQMNRRTKTGTGDGGRGLHRFHLAQAHADDGRDARLLHRDAIDRIRGLHRPWIVRDHDELRFVFELREQSDVAAHVRVVERRVDLVEQAERARLGEEDREQQRNGDQRALARRQQVDPLGAFAPRSGVDLDLALERLVLIREAYVAFAAAEQRLKDGSKVLADLGERLEEQRLGGLIDFARRLLQRVAGGHQIVALRHEELEAFVLRGVLLDRQRVHGSDGVNGATQPVVFLPQPREVTGDLRGLGEQLVQRLPPLGFHAFDEPTLAAFDLGTLELQPVLVLPESGERLARLIERALRLAEVGVGHTHLRFGVLRGVVELRQGKTTLLQRILPLRALCGERRRLPFDSGDPLSPRPSLLPRRSCIGVGAPGAL